MVNTKIRLITFFAAKDAEALQSQQKKKKDILLIIWGLECKSRKSRDTCSNRQIWPVQKEAGKRLIVLPRECTGHSKYPLPTTQEKTLHIDITRWSTPKSD